MGLFPIYFHSLYPPSPHSLTGVTVPLILFWVRDSAWRAGDMDWACRVEAQRAHLHLAQAGCSSEEKACSPACLAPQVPSSLLQDSTGIPARTLGCPPDPLEAPGQGIL